jgi:aconitate decarboxylase
MSATEQLIDHIDRLRFDDLPAATIARAKCFIEDSIGVAMAGHLGSFSPQLIAQTQKLGSAPEALVWGSNIKLPVAHAAMVNAYLIHCQEFDCVHEAAVVHPMAVILACLLAECDRRPQITGAELILGVVCAVEVAAVLGCASRSRLRFFRPAQCGALGAVAALAKLAGMGQAGIRNAMGVLLGQLSGTMQAHREGVALLPMQIAFNARNALVAFDFARAGLVGPTDMLEGEFGYLNLFEGEHDLPASLALRLTHAGKGQFAMDEVSHKPFPSGRATHGGLEALLSLMHRHQLHAGQISAITLYAPPLIRQLIDRPARLGASVNDLKLCFGYCAATAALTGGLGVLDFAPAAIRDAARFALAAKVCVQADDNTNPNALAPIRLRLDTACGTFESTVHHVLGSPGNPLSDAQHAAKLASNLALWPGIGFDDLRAAVQRLEAQPSAKLF